MNFGIIFWLNFTKNERVGQVKTYKNFRYCYLLTTFTLLKYMKYLL